MQLTLQLTSQLTRARARPPCLGDGGTVFVRHRWARRYILRVLDDGTAAGDAAAMGIEERGARRSSSRAARGSRSSCSSIASRPAVVHPDEPALRKRAAKELPAQLLALADRARHHRDARLDPQSALALGRVLVARIDHAELAADPRAAVRARVRDDSRADAPPRAESLEAVLEARGRGVSAPPRSPHVAAVGRAAAVHRSGDVLMKRMLGCGDHGPLDGCRAAGARDARAQMGMGAFKGYLTGHVGAIVGGDAQRGARDAGRLGRACTKTPAGAPSSISATPPTSLVGQPDPRRHVLHGQRDVRIRPAGFVRSRLAGAGVLQVNGCDSPCNRPARTYDLRIERRRRRVRRAQRLFAACAPTRATFFRPPIIPISVVPDNFNYWRLSFGATYMWSIAP